MWTPPTELVDVPTTWPRLVVTPAHPSRAVLPPSGCRSALRLVAAGASRRSSRRVESADKNVKASREPFVAVVEPDVLAEGDKCREAVGGQGPKERVEFVSGRGILYPLFVDGGWAAERETEGVVEDQAEGQAGSPSGSAARVQCCEKRLGEGK